MKVTRLFIGGPADGRWYDVDTNAPVFKVAELPPTPLVSITEIVPNEPGKFIKREYYPMRFKGENMTFTLMLHEGLTADDLIGMLIRRYRRG